MNIDNFLQEINEILIYYKNLNKDNNLKYAMIMNQLNKTNFNKISDALRFFTYSAIVCKDTICLEALNDCKNDWIKDSKMKLGIL